MFSRARGDFGGFLRISGSRVKFLGLGSRFLGPSLCFLGCGSSPGSSLSFEG